MILKDLLKQHPHPLSPVLKRFPRVNISRQLGITPNFLSSILTGYNKPSKPLEKKMELLAQQIIDAEKTV